MKLKALLLALFVAGFSASFALADDGGHHGKGKSGKGDGQKALTSTSSKDDDAGDDKGGAREAKLATTVSAKAAAKAAKTCRPRIEVQLAGAVASVSGSSLAVVVSKGRAQGAKLDGKQLTLDLSQAKVRGTLAAGGKVQAHARACVDLAAGTVTLVASQVKAAGAKAHDDGEDDDTTSSTTTTTTTTSSDG